MRITEFEDTSPINSPALLTQPIEIRDIQKTDGSTEMDLLIKYHFDGYGWSGKGP